MGLSRTVVRPASEGGHGDGLISVWPPLPPDIYFRNPSLLPPFPLDRTACRLFAWGRQALWHGVRALGLGPGDQVLTPAYHHGSEIEALLRAGLSCCFYDLRCGELEPDPDELEELLGPRVRALYLTHYLGYPQDVTRWRRWCDRRGLLLLEDAAQAWLGTWEERPLGSFGDLAIFCLYKTFGLPEGAALISTAPTSSPAEDPRLGISELARKNGAWLAQRSALLSKVATRVRRESAYRPEHDLALGEVGSGVWRSLPFVLARAVADDAASRRALHYQILLEALTPFVPIPFSNLPSGASPFAFPIEVADSAEKGAILDRLAGHGIKALDLWRVPHPELPVDRFPEAARRRATTVALPVHQELRLTDLDRIASAIASRPRAQPSLRLSWLDDLSPLQGEWENLAESSGNIFASWEWASTWWRHFGHGHGLHVLVGRRDGAELALLLPLVSSTLGGLSVLRFLGHGMADQLGPICRRRDRVNAARAIRSALDQGKPAWQVFLAERLAAEWGWSSLLGATTVRHASSPVLRVGGRDWEDLLASRTANFRGQVRRRERRLIRDHHLRYRLSDDPSRLQDDLSTLFALHRARWGEQLSSAFSSSRQAFHRDFAARALARGWLRLRILELDGRPAAAWYGFHYAGAEWFYQAGRDPTCETLGVGFVLLAHSVREAMAEGVSEYRFLRGDEAYKARFADRDPGLETVAMSRGVLGRVALAGVAGASALPANLRSRALGGLQ